MRFSKVTAKGAKPTIQHFNFLAHGQSYPDMIARFEALKETDTAAMFHDLLELLRHHVERRENAVSTVHSKVLLGIEQVEKPTIPLLLAIPTKVDMLTGMLADLNTEVVLGRTATSAVALRRHERGYPVEMGKIATFIDETLGLRKTMATRRSPYKQSPKHRPGNAPQ